jgi:hypothetical protein
VTKLPPPASAFMAPPTKPAMASIKSISMCVMTVTDAKALAEGVSPEQSAKHTRHRFPNTFVAWSISAKSHRPAVGAPDQRRESVRRREPAARSAMACCRFRLPLQIQRVNPTRVTTVDRCKPQ